MRWYMYSDSVLEHLTVNNGNAVYIDGNSDNINPDRTLCDDNVNLHHDVVKRISDKPSNRNKMDIPEEPHEEHYETYEEYCIHMGHLSNQEVSMCNIGQNINMCASCPYRKPGTIRVKVLSTK